MKEKKRKEGEGVEGTFELVVEISKESRSLCVDTVPSGSKESTDWNTKLREKRERKEERKQGKEEREQDKEKRREKKDLQPPLL